MRRVQLRPWMLGIVVLMMAVGTALTGASPVAIKQAAAQTVDQPGAAVFEKNCMVCHGTKASGKMGPPLNVLPPEIAQAPVDDVVKELTGLVRSGIPGAMPRFVPEQLSDDEIGQLTRYLLSLNGSVPGPSLYEALAPVTADKAPNRWFFRETGHSVGGEFGTFWNRYGGLRVFGLPLSEEYNGVSPEDGNVYRMQLFERARLELHPDNPPGYRVQLALLGAEELRLRTHFVQQGGPEGGPPQGGGQ